MRGRRRDATVGLALAAACVVLTTPAGTAGPREAAAPQAAATPAEGSLLSRVRENLQQERKLLLEYVYREKRRPVKVSTFGKVTVGDEQVFAVYPSADPDRPRRVLVAVNGRPLPDEELARRFKQADERGERSAQETAVRRRKAQDRFDDVFRVFRFEMHGIEIVDGVSARVVDVIPRPGADTRSDFGHVMKKFRGRAWVVEKDAQLVRLEMTAIDTITVGWGLVARIAEGTRVTYVRHPVGGVWLPARARFQAQGRTLLFRSFDVDTTTEWFDFRPFDDVSAVSGPPGP